MTKKGKRMCDTTRVQFGSGNAAQRNPRPCLCGASIEKPSRGRASPFCSRCRPQARQRTQLRAYLASAQRLARVLGRDDVARGIEPVLAVAGLDRP